MKQNSESLEKKLVIFLIISGMIRVAFFGATFAFFTNVDGPAHVDLVIKYSQGILPSNDSMKMNPESARLFVLYGSPEYIYPPQPNLLPFWKQLEDNGGVIKSVNQRVGRWLNAVNHENLSPPFYYFVWGAWFNLGKLIQVDEKFSLYWLKLLNLVVLAGTMLTAFHIAKLLRPDDEKLRISVLLILAVFPQDVLYSINNDVLSILLVPLGWLMLLKIGYEECTRKYIWLTGIIISLTVLTKLTNLPILIFYTMLGVWVIWKWHKRSILRSNWRYLAELISLSLIPIILWCLYNYIVIGDVMATQHKIEYLGWSKKPLSQLLEHPIFEPSGVRAFGRSILATFWRGEFTRALKHIASNSMDLFYIKSSIFLFASSVVFFFAINWRNKRNFMLIFSSFTIVIGYVSFLVFLSIYYDFGNGFYPSKQYPFFSSGRLMIGALVPFVFIYIIGLQNILKIIHLDRYMVLIVAAGSCTILINEVILSAPSVMSKFNLFALIYL